MMSTRGTRRQGPRGCGRGYIGARVESLEFDTIPNLDTSETPVSPATEFGLGSHDSAAGEDALSKAMLRILKRVTGPNTSSGPRVDYGMTLVQWG